MAIYKTISTLNDIKDLIEQSGFLETGETVAIAEDVLHIQDSQSNDLFTWASGTTGVRRAYADSTNHNTVRTTNPYNLYDGIGCKNGVIIVSRYTASNPATGLPIRIVRTNQGKMAFIFWAAASNVNPPINYEAYCNEQCCVAWGDITPLRTLDVSVRSRMQTEIVPLFTNAQLDIVSKTVKSGAIMYSPDYSTNLRYILINGHRFITDGYFAIEDEG